MDEWIDDRQIAKHRTSIKKLMAELCIDNRKGFVDMVRCVSLNDTFWVRREDSGLNWSDVSLYENSFDDVVACIAFNGVGMYGRQFYSTSPEFGTSGSFDKCWVREEDGPHLLKRGSSGYANAGSEPYSEKLCSDILDAAGIEHVPYTLGNYHGKLAWPRGPNVAERGLAPIGQTGPIGHARPVAARGRIPRFKRSGEGRGAWHSYTCTTIRTSRFWTAQRAWTTW